MNERHLIEFLLTGTNDDLQFEVRKAELDRLTRVLEEAEATPDGFFSFSAVDGRSIAVNLACVQGVQMTSNLAISSSDLVRSEAPILVCLRNREPLEVSGSSPLAVLDLFTDLELGPVGIPYPKFDDLEDRPWTFTAREVVWASAPTHALHTGARLAGIEAGLEEDE